MTKIQTNILVRAAAEARKRAYAPYSKYRVGAAIMAADNQQIFSGCNVENASFGLTICAERAAVCSAVTAGCREFLALAIATPANRPGLPCGACLQVLAEFCDGSLRIALVSGSGPAQFSTLGRLLPCAFSLRAGSI